MIRAALRQPWDPESSSISSSRFDHFAMAGRCCFNRSVISSRCLLALVSRCNSSVSSFPVKLPARKSTERRHGRKCARNSAIPPFASYLLRCGRCGPPKLPFAACAKPGSAEFTQCGTKCKFAALAPMAACLRFADVRARVRIVSFLTWVEVPQKTTFRQRAFVAATLLGLSPGVGQDAH